MLYACCVLRRYVTRTGKCARQDGGHTDATFLDYSVPLGTQVAHLAADGMVYLWYPGNSGIVVGKWTTTDPLATSRFARLCFTYGENTFNPVTRRDGGRQNCVDADQHIVTEDEYQRGDPYRLRSGQVPFVMPRDKQFTMRDLGNRMGSVVAPTR